MLFSSFKISATLAGSLLGLPFTTAAVKTPVSEDLYSRLVRYTHFSAAAYASECPNPPEDATVVQYFDESSTDTQAFLMRDDANEELILTLRGTSSTQDFATDLDQDLTPYVSPGVTCNDCTVHQGYLGQWNSVVDAVTAAIQEQPQDYSLTVTGHSMGASLAVLAAASFQGQGFDPTCYSYGEPRTGNPAFADYIDSILPQGVMFRVTHENDGVPQTFSREDGYMHHRTEYWALDPPSPANTFMCEGQEPEDCNNSVPGIGVGTNATGINAAHLEYFGISIGNPIDPGLTECT